MSRFWKVGAMILGASMLMAAPSYAAENEGDDGQEAVEQNPNDRICRRVHVTGTRIPQRICYTRARWDELEEEARDIIDQSIQNSNTATSSE